MDKIKFTVKNEDTGSVLGLSFDTERRLLVVGGPLKHADEFSETLYIGFRLVGLVWSESKGRVKFSIKLTPVDWRRGIERLGESGLLLERVSGFRRLMQ